MKVSIWELVKMLNLVEIGKYITKLRNEANMSQQELADALYVTHQAVSKWETGRSLPSIDVLVSLTKLFNITIDELLNCGYNLHNNDFNYLLRTYPREYVINQYVQGKIDVKFEEMFYLLSVEEREVILSHIINQHLKVPIKTIFPYLNPTERHRIIQAIKSGMITIDVGELAHMLTINELNQLTGGKRWILRK
ncbi:MAG: helix-turn-helix transcriptional regulator [Bacilli bacterium]|nr:helix-turn-helix transcriptional regulator [Bacilli bacterium]